MMEIVLRDEDNRAIPCNWWLEEIKPFPFNEYKVSSVVATGAELTWVRQNFTHIPMHAGPSVTWKEPWAQFIYDGLPLAKKASME